MTFAGLSEPLLRLVAFVTIFAAMALFELASPRLLRDEMAGALRSRRWFANLGVLVVSSIVLRLVFPLAAVGTALFAEAHGIGLFRMAAMPGWIGGILAFVILDFAVWLEHLASHKVPVLWRIHRMHHSDMGFDVTTALRFHPVEILLSMVWKALVVLVLGPPALAVLVFEIVLNGSAMFSHANVRLPQKTDRLVRRLIVTPDMHRVHHSSVRRETDSNYGFNFSIWDRLFRTYIGEPGAGHEGMEIGLASFRTRRTASLVWMLLLPFRR